MQKIDYCILEVSYLRMLMWKLFTNNSSISYFRIEIDKLLHLCFLPLEMEFEVV